jgi:hypothetical protein
LSDERFERFDCEVCNASCIHDPKTKVVRETVCFEHASEQEQQRRTTWVQQTRMDVDEAAL